MRRARVTQLTQGVSGGQSMFPLTRQRDTKAHRDTEYTNK